MRSRQVRIKLTGAGGESIGATGEFTGATGESTGATGESTGATGESTGATGEFTGATGEFTDGAGKLNHGTVGDFGCRLFRLRGDVTDGFSVMSPFRISVSDPFAALAAHDDLRRVEAAISASATQVLIAAAAAPPTR